MKRFKEGLLAGDEFVVTCELVPGRGYKGAGIDNILKFAEQASQSKYISGLSLTDNAGGNPALCADILGPEIKAIGPDLLVHFSCKDMNRNMVEARAYALKRAGITNLLVITGDYPISGAFGLPKPVFDIDSVIALQYLSQMSQGLDVASGRRTVKLEPTDFFLGAVASPFKPTEASSYMQYCKLEKKVRAGARFLITQLGYDSRKYAEFIKYIRRVLGLDIPVLGSVYVLSAGAGRYMAGGEVPGCYVTDRLLRLLQEEAKAEDKGKSLRLERAARQVAVLKGLGYNGAHIEGLNLKYPDVNTIMERSEQIRENWRDYVEEFGFSPRRSFFMFEGGEDFDFARDGQEPKLRRTRRRPVPSLTFWLMRFAHKLFFTQNTPGYRLMQAMAKFAEKRRPRYKLFQVLEHTAKRVLFDCRECDDCALFEMYYLCPESRCPKGQRIGPCGGSRINGNCEVFEDRPCVWERIYWRAKNRNELDKLGYVINPRDWKLYETSSWVNYFLKRDHSGNPIETLEGPVETAAAEKQDTG
jgi:methylenetetrahydrofolate reductase (NADPH)